VLGIREVRTVCLLAANRSCPIRSFPPLARVGEPPSVLASAIRMLSAASALHLYKCKACKRSERSRPSAPAGGHREGRGGGGVTPDDRCALTSSRSRVPYRGCGG